MVLFDILRRGAALAGDRIAVSHGGRRISYGELLINAEAIATFLRQSGIPTGERIALWWENSIEYVTAWFAISRAGYVVVPIDTSLKPERVGYLLNDCGARGLFVFGRYARAVDKVVAAAPEVSLVVSDLPSIDLPDNIGFENLDRAVAANRSEQALKELTATVDRIAPLEELDHSTAPDAPDDLAAIFYTSGSTGTPKGVMLSHRNLISNTIATVEYLKLTSDDSVMVILPFYYIYGNSLMLTHALVGGCLVIDNRFAFPQVILKTMAEKRVTGFSGVPSNFMLLLDKKGFSSSGLPHLRYLTQAGGAMAPEVVRRVIAAFPNKELVIMYGQTEASPRVTWCPPDMLAAKLGSIGIPVPGVQVDVVDDHGSPLPDGETGEIVVRGPNVMLGYWNQPDDQEQVLRGRTLHTGDLAIRDSDGYFFITARKKEIIKVGGNRVSAKEIEERLIEHEAVSEVAVVGVPDEVLGEAVMAYLVCNNGTRVEASQLQEHCRGTLAPHKIPKHFEFLDRLPKHQSGKVNKLALTRRV